MTQTCEHKINVSASANAIPAASFAILMLASLSHDCASHVTKDPRDPEVTQLDIFYFSALHAYRIDD